MILSAAKQRPPAFWMLPFTVYLLAFGFAQCIALAGNCHGWWELCWSRQDSGLYLEIARMGHTLKPCGVENGYMEGSDKWCGNAGWAPLYPLLIFLLSKLSTLPPEICGILIAHFCFLAFLYVCALIIRVSDFRLGNWLTLLICALCPGGFYFFSIFPLSMLALLLAVLFLAIQNEHRVRASVAAFLIALTYSSALVIFFCFGIYLLYLFVLVLRRNKSNPHKLRELFTRENPFRSILLGVFIPGVTGLLSLYTYDYLVTGHWNAMFMVQSKYGHLLYSPFKHLGGHFKLMREHLNSPELWIDLHNIFFFFAMPILVYLLIRSRPALKPLIVIYGLIMWYIPFSIGINVSLYRSILLLAPAFVYLHPQGNAVKVAILAVFGVFYYKLGVLFILNILH